MKRIWALGLALGLCLSGCASMLEREYTVSTPHQEDPPPHTDGAYQVETYPALRSALLAYVEEGMEKGLLRFPTTYEGNLTVDLEKARRQLLEEDPLGCYAVADLTCKTSKIIAYYETELTFTYKRPRAEFVSLPRVRTRGELSRLLGELAAAKTEEGTVYLTAYPESDENFFSDALAQALDSGAETEEGQPPPETEGPPGPELSVTLYPQSGTRRVAELRLTYPPPEVDPAPPERGEGEGEGGVAHGGG